MSLKMTKHLNLLIINKIKSWHEPSYYNYAILGCKLLIRLGVQQ